MSLLNYAEISFTGGSELCRVLWRALPSNTETSVTENAETNFTERSLTKFYGHELYRVIRKEALKGFYGNEL